MKARHHATVGVVDKACLASRGGVLLLGCFSSALADASSAGGAAFLGVLLRAPACCVVCAFAAVRLAQP